jgi:hypothetical protein
VREPHHETFIGIMVNNEALPQPVCERLLHRIRLGSSYFWKITFKFAPNDAFAPAQRRNGR